jgi:hypothetical protein
MIIKALESKDKKRILEISSQIWDGNDYIPFVLDEWIQDENDFVGLWADDVLIAFNRLCYLTDEDAWLEGLRKDQTIKIKGVTDYLLDYHLKKIMDNKKTKTLRFSTYFENVASIKVHEKRNFKKILELSLLELTGSLPKPTKYYKSHSRPENYNQSIEFILNSSFLRLSENNIVSSWTCYPAKEIVIKELINKSHYLEIRENNIIIGIAIFSMGKEQNNFWISFIQAENEDLLLYMLNIIYNQARNQNISILKIIVPDNWFDLEKFGFFSWERKHDFWLYDLELKK